MLSTIHYEAVYISNTAVNKLLFYSVAPTMHASAGKWDLWTHKKSFPISQIKNVPFNQA